MRRFIVSGVVIAIGFAASPTMAALSGFDREFLTQATQDNVTAVQDAQWGNKSTQTPPIKGLAQRIIKDHSDALAELKTIAENQQVSLPTQPTTHQQAVSGDLKNESGDHLRRDYLQRQVDQRKKDIDLCQREMREGTDAALHQYCQHNLPNFQQELTMAQSTLGDAKPQ